MADLADLPAGQEDEVEELLEEEDGVPGEPAQPPADGDVAMQDDADLEEPPDDPPGRHDNEPEEALAPAVPYPRMATNTYDFNTIWYCLRQVEELVSKFCIGEPSMLYRNGRFNDILLTVDNLAEAMLAAKEKGRAAWGFMSTFVYATRFAGFVAQHHDPREPLITAIPPTDAVSMRIHQAVLALLYARDGIVLNKLSENVINMAMSHLIDIWAMEPASERPFWLNWLITEIMAWRQATRRPLGPFYSSLRINPTALLLTRDHIAIRQWVCDQVMWGLHGAMRDFQQAGLPILRTAAQTAALHMAQQPLPPPPPPQTPKRQRQEDQWEAEAGGAMRPFRPVPILGMGSQSASLLPAQHAWSELIMAWVRGGGNEPVPRQGPQLDPYPLLYLGLHR